MKLRFLDAAVLVAALFTAAAEAQILATKQCSYFRSFGVSDANCYVDFHCLGQRELVPGRVGSSTASLAYVRAKGGVSLFGRSLDAITTEMRARTAPTGNSAGLVVKLAGYTMVSRSTSLSTTWTHAFGPYDLFPIDPSLTLPVGPISVTIGGNVGVGADGGVHVGIDPASVAAVLDGSVRAYGVGQVEMCVGWPGYNVGITAQLRFADAQAGAFVHSSVSGVRGDARIEIAPLALKVLVRVSAWPLSWCTQVLSWALAAIDRTFTLA